MMRWLKERHSKRWQKYKRVKRRWISFSLNWLCRYHSAVIVLYLIIVCLMTQFSFYISYDIRHICSSLKCWMGVIHVFDAYQKRPIQTFYIFMDLRINWLCLDHVNDVSWKSPDTWMMIKIPLTKCWFWFTNVFLCGLIGIDYNDN